MSSTRNHKEIFLSFLYRIANIGTEEEFFERFKTTAEEVSRFMKGDPLPPSWLSELFDCHLSTSDYATVDHLLEKIYGPHKKIFRVRPDEYSAFLEPDDELSINPKEERQADSKDISASSKNKDGEKRHSPITKSDQEEEIDPQNRNQWTPGDISKLAEDILKKVIKKIRLGNHISISALNDEVAKTLSGHKIILDDAKGLIILFDENEKIIAKHKMDCDIRISE